MLKIAFDVNGYKDRIWTGPFTSERQLRAAVVPADRQDPQYIQWKKTVGGMTCDSTGIITTLHNKHYLGRTYDVLQSQVTAFDNRDFDGPKDLNFTLSPLLTETFESVALPKSEKLRVLAFEGTRETLA